MKKHVQEIVVNKLCRKCLRACRQSETILLIDCPRFLPRPFVIETPRFDQLDLFTTGDAD
jgi:hypothetical protein